MQADNTRAVCDQEKRANIEGEVWMGATRADGCRRVDEETWEKCYDGAIVARWSSVNRGCFELAMRKLYRETHKRNSRPQQQEQVLFFSVFFGSFGILDRILLLAFRWEQYHDTASSGFEYSHHWNRGKYCPVCAGKQVTVSRDV